MGAAETFPSTSPCVNASPSSRPRPIKSPKHIQVHAHHPGQQFNVPNGPNWVYASGGSIPVRFDFGKALNEQIASEDETCGSSQEYYARKSALSSTRENGCFVPPVLPTYKPDPRFMYPTQRPNYAFNFDRATPADVQNMNTALPFGPTPSSERKQKTRKDIDKLPRPSPRQIPFEFGNKRTTFSPPTATSTGPATRANLPTLTLRSQNHDGNSRRSAAKAHTTASKRT